MLKIYNSLNDKIEEFIPLNEKQVNMYVCGPTVYDDIHIGNARPVIFFDVLKNYLTYLDYSVNYATNITDVDDKIIEKAIKNNTNPKEIATKYTEAFLSVIKPIITELPLYMPHATNYIDAMISFIKDLISKEFAYVTKSGVYFRITKIKDYGAISNQTIENLIQGSRIEVIEDKENALDFALWKFTNDEFTYLSPWGAGRPGWHTECSVMINELFEGPIDIHGGGFDLKFPHHENERAQSIAHNNHGLSKYWMHVARLDLDNAKMSKSIGNVIKVKDLYKDYQPEVFKLMMLAHHYRQPINYSDDLIKQYQTVYVRHQNTLNKMKFKMLYNNVNIVEIDHKMHGEFIKYMNDDINTPNVFTVINELIKTINQNEDPRSYNTVLKIYEVLGVNLNLNDYTEEDIKTYDKWQDARNNKDYKKADELRNELMEKAIL